MNNLIKISSLFALLLLTANSNAQTKAKVPAVNRKDISKKPIQAASKTVTIASKQEPTKTASNASACEKEIKWLSWDEAQAQMAIKPKKVYVDIFTDWCGWCKVMDSKTFHNANVIKYMNENFYCIRFNSEKDNLVKFQGKVYELDNGVNALATKLMNGKASYPTSIFFEENFANPQPVPGYLDLLNFETITNYLNSNSFKTTPFDQFKETFKPSWN
jgi:thioredoxin-related protein